MEKAKYSAFDLFGYALPGIFLLFSLNILLNPKITTLKDIVIQAGEYNLNQAIIALILGYILGFTFYKLGTALRRFAGKRFWKDNRNYELAIPESEKLVLVREFCHENFKYIQTWFLISGMAANLALGSIALTITSLIKMLQVSNLDALQWLGLIIISLFMTFFQLEKSSMYIKWARRELNQAIVTFDLKNKTITNSVQD